MSKKSQLTVKEQQTLKVLLEAIEDKDKDGAKQLQENEKQDSSEFTTHLAELSGCIDEGEIQRFIDLGLGRGIDVSNPTPWQNKTSIQVRPVSFDTIIGTEESGSMQSYEREIIQVSETHWRFSPSAVFNPNLAAEFSIGVEDSYPHLHSTLRKFVVGTKVLNRTVSFKEIFHGSKDVDQLHPNSLAFEAWLCKWILKKYVTENERPIDVDGRIDTLRKEVLALNGEVENLEMEFSELKSKHEMIVGENAVESIKAELQELKHKKKITEMEKEKLENKRKWFLNTLEKEYKKTGQMDEKQFKLDEFDQDFKFEEVKHNKELDEIERRIILLTERYEDETNKLQETEARLREANSAKEGKKEVLIEKTSKLRKTQPHQFAVNELRKRLSRPELRREKIANYCSQFLATFRLTHYVSSIQLGASGYKVVEKSEAAKSQKVRNSVRVDKIAAGKATCDSTSSRAHSKKSKVGVSKIGIIEMGEGNEVSVKRKSHQEGVIGVQVKPVSDLVAMPELREPLKESLLHYVRSEGNTSGYNYTEGPFLIRCEIDGKIFYWSVDDFHNVQAKKCDAAEATPFYIKPRSHREHLNEFYLVYFESQNKKHADPFLPHYLQRSISIFGRDAKQTLRFGLYSQEKDTPLALFKQEVDATPDQGQSVRFGIRRRHSSWSSVSLSSWINEPAKSCIIQHIQHGRFMPSIFVAGVVLPEEREAEQSTVENVEKQESSLQRGAATDRQEQPVGEEPQKNRDDDQPQRQEEEEGSVSEQHGVDEVDEVTQPDQEIEEAANDTDGSNEAMEYRVSWIEADARMRAIKTFEIVSTLSENHRN